LWITPQTIAQFSVIKRISQTLFAPFQDIFENPK